ncbi:MAG TPA: thymidine kinase [Spirochaetia bacterium]|nr:thymidine kinase [Spirochaetia bacterium]
MFDTGNSTETDHFLKSLGFPSVQVHHSLNHFDFMRSGRRILVIGPMGSGKTEFSARVWRDAQVTIKKSPQVGSLTTVNGADRRRVFFIRSLLDTKRFEDYPPDSLAYRGGYESCGENIACIRDSFELEELLERRPDVGTWIIDEASFYDERLAYVVRSASEKNGLVFIFPTLILNFRKDIFNATARFLLETATDVFPLTAYCEHDDCIEDSFYTYRFYRIDGLECPALYFDPLIVIGGDKESHDPFEPNYCTRCDAHHYLPGKAYTYLVLKPLGEEASRGNRGPLVEELRRLKWDMAESKLYRELTASAGEAPVEMCMNSLRVPNIAEKAVIFLFAEQNLLTEDAVRALVDELSLDRDYIARTLADNRRPINLSQYGLRF